MVKKAPRRTRERILELALRLYNDFGEPNVTTTTLSDEMGISPGNLYYHFRNKDEITNSVFEDFEREMDRLLGLTKEREANIEDAWFFLHLMFELIWKYRFLYRDLNDLLSRNRLLENHFKTLIGRKTEAAMRLLGNLQLSGNLKANELEMNTLATNMVVVTTYWLSYEYMQYARQFNDPATQGQGMARGAYQVLSLVSPFLQGEARAHFQHLAEQYLKPSE
jgi:AcrR family transcriptional regulator